MLSLIYFPNEVIAFSPLAGSFARSEEAAALFSISGLSLPLKNTVYFIRIHVSIRSFQGIWEMYTFTSMVYAMYGLNQSLVALTRVTDNRWSRWIESNCSCKYSKPRRRVNSLLYMQTFFLVLFVSEK